ncbi:GSS, partial [Cordylochernes scorpioides]
MDPVCKHGVCRSIENDEFTEKLFSIYEDTRSNPRQAKQRVWQPYSLGLLRTDYMINLKTNQLGQIETNTIASSFAGLVTRLGDLHQLTAPLSPQMVLNEILLRSLKPSSYPELALKSPYGNNPVRDLANGLVQAWKKYDSEGSVVLFLVEEVNQNFSDQRLLEKSVVELEPRVKVLFKTFRDLRKHGQLSDGGILTVGDHEVAVVYYRTGYDPNLYNEGDWEVRLMVERSRAIKCPSIHFHLAGSKKIQQELCRPGVLERYLPDATRAAQVRETFVPQYSLDMNREGDQAVELALKNPADYVLKPQREGGGHNIYGEDIREALLRWGQSEERQSYILMERVRPPTWNNYLVRSDSPPVQASIVSELGVYGVVLGNEKSILVNEEAGLLLRSK